MFVEGDFFEFILDTTLVGPATDVIFGGPPLEFAKFEGTGSTRVEFSVIRFTITSSLDALLSWCLSRGVDFLTVATAGTSDALGLVLVVLVVLRILIGIGIHCIGVMANASRVVRGECGVWSLLFVGGITTLIGAVIVVVRGIGRLGLLVILSVDVYLKIAIICHLEAGLYCNVGAGCEYAIASDGEGEA